MPGYRVHDRLGIAASAALGATLLYTPHYNEPKSVGVAMVCCVLSTLYLSPDLDTHSMPYARWGPLKVLWWPYQRLVGHRSIISHAPVLGVCIRLALIGAWWVWWPPWEVLTGAIVADLTHIGADWVVSGGKRWSRQTLGWRFRRKSSSRYRRQSPRRFRG